MRVLESGATPSYNMGKNKKHKIRKTKEVSDSSDDALPGGCRISQNVVSVLLC